ncbi:MAG: nicotinate (nicotinamide) nucleotide adenylyltransferase [Planctomycetes bacterium]|nr:nicotinate (nicotinamide) nucleotide adenylyltransferase [Planctomycetota bacterium]
MDPDRLVVLGGTFNPVHVAHLIVARHVAEHFGAPRVLLMPTGCPPHKEAPLAAAEHRLAMLRRVAQDDPLFDVSTLELERRGPSYTYDTLVDLRRQVGQATELVWIIGMDMLAELPNWHRVADVVALARLVTVARPPMPPDLGAVLAGLRRTCPAGRVDQLERDILATPLIDISSTQIRRRCREGRSIAYLTPAPVAAYIQTHGLYA